MAGWWNGLTRAEKSGLGCLLMALFCLGPCPELSAVVLGTFLAVTVVAPFFPCWSYFLPVHCRARSGIHGVVLTIDDGPHPQSTPVLLGLLARYGLRATFFVVGCQAAAYPELIQAILEQGHTIGNHSWDHHPLLMFHRPRLLAAKIGQCQQVLSRHGIRPRVFRPPMGITGPRLGPVLRKQGLVAVAYSCRALDRGNRDVHRLATKLLERLRPGGIILLHDLPPAAAQFGRWQGELETLFSSLQKTYQVISLEDALQMPVMVRTGTPE